MEWNLLGCDLIYCDNSIISQNGKEISYSADIVLFIIITREDEEILGKGVGTIPLGNEYLYEFFGI